MKEALRLTAPGKIESEAVKELREQLQLPEVDHEKWMDLPRKYTRASARFGLPMDTRELSSECFFQSFIRKMHSLHVFCLSVHFFLKSL